MTPDDVVLTFRFKDEDDNINRYIANNLDFCDCFVALDDRSESNNVYRRLMKHSKCAGIVRKNKPWTDMHDNLDKQTLYSLALTTGKPWMLILDLDELMDQRWHDEMEKVDPETKLICFPYAYLFPDETHCISKDSSNGVYGVRKSFFPCAFKITPDLCYPQVIDARLHVGRLPKKGVNQKILDAVDEYFNPKMDAWSLVYHYSMVTEELRKERFEFYEKYDPNRDYQESYDHILREDYEVQKIEPRIKT
jgi:hypothetical protein